MRGKNVAANGWRSHERDNLMERAVIRVGDRTSHGGVVVTGDQQVSVFGKPAARKGDMTTCPKCGGDFPIVDGALFCASERPIALHGMRTACGASLIASQEFWTLSYASADQPSVAPFASFSPYTCPHPDVAEKIAAYIVTEMNKNPSTPQGRAIKAYNSYDPREAQQAWDAGPWYMKLGGQPDFASNAQAQKISAYTAWAERVASGRDWDHKRPIANAFPTPKTRELSGWHKYQAFDYYQDIWSNIHYGYVGVAVGFTADELLNGAGLAQAWSDRYKPQLQSHPVNGNWPKTLDDVQDNISIRLGIDLFAEAPPGRLTTDLLLTKIAAVPVPWGESPGGSKRPHRCE
ncbi:PAAR domain-containing protein [Achromobacter aloeverae]